MKTELISCGNCHSKIGNKYALTHHHKDGQFMICEVCKDVKEAPHGNYGENVYWKSIGVTA